ncbi:MAG: hypothetical protein SGPRY_004597 [Prymnesium sp.]
MSGGPGAGKTLGGVQRKLFAPNVNARRNKKQSDPSTALDKLLSAEEQTFDRAEHKKPHPKIKVERGAGKSRSEDPKPEPAGPRRATPLPCVGLSIAPRVPVNPVASDGPAVLQIPSSHAATEAAAAAESARLGAQLSTETEQEENSLGRELQASSAWLHEPHAPFVLPLKPPLADASRAPSALPRPPSEASGVARSSSPASRPSSRFPGHHKPFPRASAAAALLGARQVEAAELQRLTLFQLPMHLPIRKDGSAASPAEYLEALTHSPFPEFDLFISDPPSFKPALPHRPAPHANRVRQLLLLPRCSNVVLDPVDKDPSKRLASFADLEEGQLGTLVVRKYAIAKCCYFASRSGKVSLEIGDFLLDVEPGTECTFEQVEFAAQLPARNGERVAPACRLLRQWARPRIPALIWRSTN